MNANAVKIRILGAGLSLGEVCNTAGISKSTLSNHLAGRRRSHNVQLRILLAYNHLARKSLTIKTFWGDLAANAKESA